VHEGEESIARRAEQRAVFQNLGGNRRLAKPIGVGQFSSAGLAAQAGRGVGITEQIEPVGQ